MVGSPHLHDVHFHEGEPLRLTVHFEVAPDVELKEYRELEVVYQEPAVSDEDIAQSSGTSSAASGWRTGKRNTRAISICGPIR